MDTIEQNELSQKEIYDFNKGEKNQKKSNDFLKQKNRNTVRSVIKIAIWTFIVVLIIILVGWMIARLPQMPTITSQGHSEDIPESHILTTTMPIPLQAHMLEHADGVGLPGIIIQYNCDKYSCNDSLVSELEKLVKKFPKNVYLAPSKYDGMIILTREGRREILESFDEKKITDFIQ